MPFRATSSSSWLCIFQSKAFILIFYSSFSSSISWRPYFFLLSWSSTASDFLYRYFSMNSVNFLFDTKVNLFFFPPAFNIGRPIKNPSGSFIVLVNDFLSFVHVIFQKYLFCLNKYWIWQGLMERSFVLPNGNSLFVLSNCYLYCIV